MVGLPSHHSSGQSLSGCSSLVISDGLRYPRLFPPCRGAAHPSLFRPYTLLVTSPLSLKNGKRPPGSHEGALTSTGMHHDQRILRSFIGPTTGGKPWLVRQNCASMKLRVARLTLNFCVAQQLQPNAGVGWWRCLQPKAESLCAAGQFGL